VRPEFSAVLAALVAEQKARVDLDAAKARFAARFGDGEPAQRASVLAALRAEGHTEPGIAAFHRELLQVGDAAAVRVERLVQSGSVVDALDRALAALLRDHGTLPFAELGETVRDMREHGDVLPDLLPLLGELVDADPVVAKALRALPLLPDAIELAVAREGLERLYRVERWLPRFDGAVLAGHVRSLSAAEKKLLALNARVVRAGVHHRFLRNVQLSTLAASQLDSDGKAFKKSYAAGRRELEHEFGKTMRYKAIRELASGDPGGVVRDMKPVWLMSPLSVSDTLPLATDLFDLIVFDEASQIPVEEAVPALYRAPQTIIVGDEMQLPPTSFFASSRDAEDDTVAVDEDGERVAIVFDADSLLNQGARNLPATLLAWHYRSRHESLIGFSNAAFYAGQLFTIPDRAVPGGQRAPIVADAGEGGSVDVAANVDALLARAISFHFVERSPYADRRNEGEARTIARLVRELLQRETGLSIGIAAFSEAQQTAIEEALAELGEEDADFAARLEAESTREQDDQFCGLFVKNLDNVQGDERDVILLSVCYGPNAQGKMAMNFGPINQRGGEKRLNVIFSRARQHMAVVSSIRHGAITNDYNEGAAALKSFLRYAEQVSLGDAVLAQRVLEGLNPLARQALGGANVVEAVATQLADALRRRGHAVDERIGQSRFRCDIGVRAPAGGDHYALGVMVDTAEHYANRDVLERYVARPRILGAFGWRTLQVLARDWHHDREGVLDAIERALREPEVVEAPAAETEAALPVAATEAPDVTSGAPTPDDVGPPNSSPAAAPSPDAPHLPWRRLEFVDGTSRKFWQARLEGTDVVVSFGRIGTTGQSQRKQFTDIWHGQAEIDKLVAEKLRKGYLQT
jgi:predicted DNA-binding WGR domain protein